MDPENTSYKNLFESLPEAYLILDREFRIIAASNTYLEATMTVREDIIGKNIFAVFPDNPDDPGANGVAKLRQSLQYVLEHKVPHTMEIQKYDIRRPDGTYEKRSWKPLNTPVFDDQNEVEMIMHRVENVTEISIIREKLETSEKTALSEKRFRALIENNNEGISLFDAEFRPFYRSPAISKISGYPEEESMQGANISTLHPEDHEQVTKIMKDVMANPGKTFPMAFRQLHKAGHYIWLEGTLLNLLHDESVGAIVSNLRDVTERKQYEKELLLLSSIINSSEDAIISIDLNGKVTSWNPGAERLFGWKTEDILGNSVLLLIPNKRRGEELDILEKITSGKTVQHYVTERLHKNGTHVIVSLSVSPVRDTAGIIIGASKISRDITALNRANENIRQLNIALEKRAKSLEESNQELERFAYIASHDLQEPLRMVSSFLQLLRKKYSPALDETANQYISYAVDGAERMKKLIHDLLEYSRVGVNKDDFTELDLDQMVGYVSGLFKDRLQSCQAELTVSKLPVIRGSKVQITQLFQNLLSNAIKYKGKEPLRIDIGCEQKKDKWEFYVNDNGIGIDPKYFEKIFIIFQRLHNKSEFAGTGIGLSICKKIVERHGGKMWVESSPGKGSSFRFLLPDAGSSFS